MTVEWIFAPKERTPEQMAALDTLEMPDGQGRMGPDPLTYPR